MAVEVAFPLYTSRAEIESIFSVEGVDLRLDDDEDGVIGVGVTSTSTLPNEEGFLSDAIEEATDEINTYLHHFYDPARLATSRWVRRRASYFAANILSTRRGNAPQFEEKVCQYRDQLERVRRGLDSIPRLPKRFNQAPSMSNLVVDRRYCEDKIRVSPTSTGQRSPLQSRDWIYSYYCYAGGAYGSYDGTGTTEVNTGVGFDVVEDDLVVG